MHLRDKNIADYKYSYDNEMMSRGSKQYLKKKLDFGANVVAY